MEGKNSSEESDLASESDEDSSDDEHTWTKEVKKQHKIIQREHWEREKKEMAAREEENKSKQPKMFELRRGEEFKGLHNLKRKIDR